MNKKKNLLNLFTQDVEYNYHLIKTDEPIGHLIYVIKNESELNTDTLEFSSTKIVQELIDECNVKVERFAPSIFFSEEENTSKLKYLLDEKLKPSEDFSNFIESIKDEYRILEVRDSLLYKKDPEAYEAAKQKEHEEHQKELWDEMIKQHENKKKKRENTLLAYNNDLIKLMKEYFEGIIEFEKRDFNLLVEFEKLLGNLIDPETWIKVNDQPYICRAEICSLEQDRINVYLTDNNDYSYTATLRFDKTVLITENVVRINDGDNLPECMQDYEFLIQLYDVDVTNVENWDLKDHTDRFEYVIDYLAPIFKAEKDRKQKEIIEKMKLEESLEDEDDEDDEDNEDDDKPVKVTQPSDWYFDVNISNDDFDISTIALVKKSFWNKNHYFDDQLGSHSLSQNIIDALNRAGIFGDCELMEAIWEVVDSESKTKDDIIKAMKNEGFEYCKNMTKIAMGNDYDSDDESNDNDSDDNNNSNSKTLNTMQPSDWYFDVFVSDDINDPSCIALSEDGNGLDDQLGSHSLSQNVIDALNRAGIFGDCELMEAIWEVTDYESKTKEDIIKAMKNEGFIYLPGFMN